MSTETNPLRFYHYPSPDAEAYWVPLEDWLATLEPGRDQRERSYGPRSSRAWFYYQNFLLGKDDVLGTYFGVDANNKVVVIGTLVDDDRGVRQRYKIPGNGMWGLVLTHHEHRQRGYGKAVCVHIDAVVQNRVEQTKIPETYSLFTGYPPAVKMYTQLGFNLSRQIVIDDPGLTGGGPPLTRDLYVKTYTPSLVTVA
jgi:GNAT superfamily N-acetyltransferase